MTDTTTPIEQQLAAELRELADWIATRPIIAEAMRYSLSDLYAFPGKENWAAALREAGSFHKGASGGYLNAEVKFGLVGVQLTIEKELTCERVQVGEETVERVVYPDDVEPTVVTETVPRYEWKCPPSWIGEQS